MHSFIQTFILLFTLGLLSVVHAADRPNILVMSDDSQAQTVPRDSRVIKSVVSALQGQLFDKQFDVYDESAVSLDHFSQGRIRRSDAELLDIARSINRPPIDIVVVFSLYASTQKQNYTTKVSARIIGHMLNVQSGKFLGEFSVNSGQFWNAPQACSRECLAEVLADKAAVLANDLGAVLSEKLAWQIDEQQGSTEQIRAASNNMLSDYYLVFDGFSAEDFMQIEEYLVIFSGYDSLRPTEQMHTRVELLYRSSASNAKLNRNLKKMLHELGMRAMLHFESNTFTIKRITLRGQEAKAEPAESW